MFIISFSQLVSHYSYFVLLTLLVFVLLLVLVLVLDSIRVDTARASNRAGLGHPLGLVVFVGQTVLF
jgi:hypothetical protein